MKAIICGSTTFKDWEKTLSSLDYWHSRFKFSAVILGGHVTTDPAEQGVSWLDRKKWGADVLARRWAELRGVQIIEEVVSDQERKTLHEAAGPRRNRRMIDRHKPGVVIDLMGGDDTRDMLNQARAAKIKCIEVA